MMNEQYFNKIADANGLTCSQADFENYLSTMDISGFSFPDIDVSVHEFSEPYNGVILQNKTGNAMAVYYVLKIGNSIILQTHLPGVQGFQAITQRNVNATAQAQYDFAKNSALTAWKVQQAINFFKQN